MNDEQFLQEEQSLDPADWELMRQLGHRMVDDMMDYLRTLRERPVWQATTEAVREQFNHPLPAQGENPEVIYNDFLQYILPYNKGNIHPRFWSWVQGTGSPLAMLADMLASGMNPNVAIGDHAALYVERQVIEWCKQMLGFAAGGSGILVSGGSVANITCIQVARNAFENGLIRRDGLQSLPGKLLLYASEEAHSCIQKAAEVAGLGKNGLRLVPVDGACRMNLARLKSMVKADRKAGHIPFCVVATAGTVNTGAFDPLDDIRDFCRREQLWFHIDGAFGALAKLVQQYTPVLKALEDADSLAFDLHKWMYLPYEAGCVLVRDAQIHRSAFALQPTYLVSHERGLAAGPDPITNYGMELSRSFKALKVWMSLREHGLDKFRQLIRQNIDQVFYLARQIREQPQLELLAPVSLNIACFRFHPGGLTEQQLNLLNKEILMELHCRGIAAPSYTMLKGKYAIRVAHVNHRSRKEDFDALVKGVLEIGREMTAI